MIINRIGTKIILFTLLFLSLIPILILLPFREALVFQFQNSERVLAYIPIQKGEFFQIKYTHSIHLSDVYEKYIVTNDGLIKQIELEYEDFAIGMPENASAGEIFTHRNGKYYLSNMNRIFPKIDLRIGKVRAKHTVIFEKKEYPLSLYIKPGTWVRIKIEKLNIWQLWKGVNMNE